MAGAVVVDHKGGRCAVEGLKRWPDNLLNRGVRLFGDFIKVRQRSGLNGASSRSAKDQAPILVKNANRKPLKE